MTAHGVSFGSIPIEDIDVGERLRRTDPAWVEALARTIDTEGLLTPIEVVLEETHRFTLLAGAHRLAAVTGLGWSDVAARIVDHRSLKPQERRMHELLENLVRNELSMLDRARALSELKVVYEALHPERRNGGDRKSQAAQRHRENQNEIFAFCSDTAKKIGLSRRSIELAVSIWHGLSEDSRERLQGTSIADHQASLKELAQQPDNTQKRVLDLVLADPRAAANVADALTLIRDGRLQSTSEKSWNRAFTVFERLRPADRRRVFSQFEDDVRAYARHKGWMS